MNYTLFLLIFFFTAITVICNHFFLPKVKEKVLARHNKLYTTGIIIIIVIMIAGSSAFFSCVIYSTKDNINKQLENAKKFKEATFQLLNKINNSIKSGNTPDIEKNIPDFKSPKFKQELENFKNTIYIIITCCETKTTELKEIQKTLIEFNGLEGDPNKMVEFFNKNYMRKINFNKYKDKFIIEIKDEADNPVPFVSIKYEDFVAITNKDGEAEIYLRKEKRNKPHIYYYSHFYYGKGSHQIKKETINHNYEKETYILKKGTNQRDEDKIDIDLTPNKI